MLWRESKLKTVRCCGRYAFTNGTEVGIVPGDAAGIAGVQRCASPWACPVCAAVLAARRREEVHQVLTWAAAQGYDVGLLTLTMRHKSGDSLAELWDGLSAAWGAVTSGRIWAGESQEAFAQREQKWVQGWIDYRAGIRQRRPAALKPRRYGLVREYGVVGWVRACEVTRGANGWHVHLHVVMVLDQPAQVVGERAQVARSLGEISGEEVDARSFTGAVLSVRMHEVFSRALERRGFESWANRGGLDFQLVTPTDVETVGDYLLKGMAYEATSGVYKEGRKSRTPFQILNDVVQVGDAEDLALWHTWERASKGRRQVTWSQGMRELAGLAQEQTDEEIVAEKLGETDQAVLVSANVWHEGLNEHSADLVERAREGVEALTKYLDDLGVRWRIGDRPQFPTRTAEAPRVWPSGPLERPDERNAAQAM